MKDPVRMAARLDSDAVAAQGLHLRSKLVQRLLVRHRNDRAERMERPRSGNPAPRQADDRYFLAFKIPFTVPPNNFSRMSEDDDIAELRLMISCFLVSPRLCG